MLKKVAVNKVEVKDESKLFKISKLCWQDIDVIQTISSFHKKKLQYMYLTYADILFSRIVHIKWNHYLPECLFLYFKIVLKKFYFCLTFMLSYCWA